MALYGKTFSAVFYDNVRVPAKCMVGPENGGWKVITDALAAERVMIGGSRMAGLERAFDRLTSYIRTAKVNGKVVLDAQWGGGISKNPYLAFKVKGAKAGDKVAVNWVDNTGDKNAAEATIS